MVMLIFKIDCYENAFEYELVGLLNGWLARDQLRTRWRQLETINAFILTLF